MLIRSGTAKPWNKFIVHLCSKFATFYLVFLDTHTKLHVLYNGDDWFERAGVNVLLLIIWHDLPSLPGSKWLLDAEGDLLTRLPLNTFRTGTWASAKMYDYYHLLDSWIDPAHWPCSRLIAPDVLIFRGQLHATCQG